MIEGLKINRTGGCGIRTASITVIKLIHRINIASKISSGCHARASFATARVSCSRERCWRRAYYGTRWRARGDHCPRATVPQQQLRSLYIGVRAARARAAGSHCSSSLSLSLSFASLSLRLSFFCGSLCWLSLFCSLCSFFALCVVLRRSITFYIGAVDRIRSRLRFRLAITSAGPLAFLRFLS